MCEGTRDAGAIAREEALETGQSEGPKEPSFDDRTFNISMWSFETERSGNCDHFLTGSDWKHLGDAGQCQDRKWQAKDCRVST